MWVIGKGRVTSPLEYLLLAVLSFKMWLVPACYRLCHLSKQQHIWMFCQGGTNKSKINRFFLCDLVSLCKENTGSEKHIGKLFDFTLTPFVKKITLLSETSNCIQKYFLHIPRELITRWPWWIRGDQVHI